MENLIRTAAKTSMAAILLFALPTEGSSTCEESRPGLNCLQFSLYRPSSPGLIKDLMLHMQKTNAYLNSFSEGKIFHADFTHLKQTLMVTTIVYGFDLGRKKFSIKATVEWFSTGSPRP
ncbi:MAG: hypothetical protein ACOCXC_04030 [Fibrobacterota bacterium]